MDTRRRPNVFEYDNQDENSPRREDNVITKHNVFNKNLCDIWRQLTIYLKKDGNLKNTLILLI